MVIDAKNKALFIFPAAGALILMLIASLVMIIVSDDRTAWLGAAISTLPLPIILTQLTLRPAPRTSENLPLLLLIAAIGVMVAGWEQFIEGTSGWGPTSVALAAALLFLMYVFWFSRFGRFDSVHLMVGNKLPSFSLVDTDGNSFSSASLEGDPAIVMFYRGNWCPICMAQVAELADRHEDISALGIQVALISPQSAERSRELAEKYDVPFKFLVDEDGKVAEALGIASKNNVPVGLPGGYSAHSVLPTVVVANENGTILYSDQTDNYRVRPEPDIFLAILRRAGAGTK